MTKSGNWKNNLVLKDADISRIQGYIDPLKKAEELAMSLRASVPASGIFASVCGSDLAFESRELLPGAILVRRVTNPPGIVHVCCAADANKTDYLGVARYSGGTTAEIVIGEALSKVHSTALNLAWHAVVLLKLRGQWIIYCPAFTTVSWDTVASYRDQRLEFHLLDDVSRQITLWRNGKLAVDDVEWASLYFDNAMVLRNQNDSRRFGLAYELFYKWNHTSDIRMAILALWSGLESLFGSSADPLGRHTSRLLGRIRDWTKNVTMRDLRRLYRTRCEATHGRWCEVKDLAEPTRNTAELLRDCLVLCIERNEKTLPDEK